jgi:oligopeptide/dipeptide ABC transporter ATP-binding protein
MGLNRLIDIENLSVSFHTADGDRSAIDNVSFGIRTGETLGLVGESGCGKSVTALSILGLLDHQTAHIQTGRIMFKQQNLLGFSNREMRTIRGNDISMIFQEPMTSLNPVLPIGRQVAEPLMAHQGMDKVAAYASAQQWLERVNIPMAKRRMKAYPHHLSGGMRQRVMIAMAMICRPSLLIADEPTTALDVSTQSQILTLIENLKNDLHMSVLLITHDLGIVAQTVDRVVVMYAGQIMETGRVVDIFDHPAHPYTKGLLLSIPHMGISKQDSPKRLREIPGSLPSGHSPIIGCRFAARCPDVFKQCREMQPELVPIHDHQWARCWMYNKV